MTTTSVKIDKYTIQHEDGANVRVLRNDLPWLDGDILVGQKMLIAVADEIETLRTKKAQAVQLNPTLSMVPMESETGTEGWYIDGPDFYCDIEREPGEHYSVFIRSKDGAEGFAKIYQPVEQVQICLTDIDLLAKMHSSSYASPHHMTFSVQGLQALVQAAIGNSKETK